MPTKIEDQQTSRTDALLSKAVVEKKQGQSLKINWLIFACSFCFSGGYFPEFVVMVPVSLWGSSLGVEGVFARRCVYARNRS